MMKNNERDMRNINKMYSIFVQKNLDNKSLPPLQHSWLLI